MSHFVVFLFKCLTFHVSKEKDSKWIPRMMGVKSPWDELEEIASTTKSELDSIITCLSIFYRAIRMPSSIAKASVTSTSYCAGSSFTLAATTTPLQSRITTPTIEGLPSSDVAPSTFILCVPDGGALQPTSEGCSQRRVTAAATL